jgi:hypothetical protein
VGPERVLGADVVIERPLHVRHVENERVESSSSRSVRWNRSILPVVVGERTAVSRWRIPFSRQIRSNRTSCRLRAARSLNTRLLSVSTPWGTP